MEQYAVVNYDDRRHDVNEIMIHHTTYDFDYANKLAFHYAKKKLPSKELFQRYECKIIKNYDTFNSVFIHSTVVDYRIGELEYDDECEQYNITNVWNGVWAVIKIQNDVTEMVEDIDESLIYKA